MFKRQRAGSVVCTSCGVLVGVNDEACYNCGRRNPGLWGFAPALRALGTDLGFIPFVMGACIAIYALMVIFILGVVGTDNLIQVVVFGPSGEALAIFGASGERPLLRQHRWWTVLSAGWLHAGLFHLAMNMFSLRQLAYGISDMFGPGRMIIIYTAGAVAGFTASSLAGRFLPGIPYIGGGIITVGASASIAGLIGAVLAYGHRSGNQTARSYAMQGVVMLLIIGVVFNNVDNWAHFGGFAGGYVAAKRLDPMKPERIDHIAIAIGCLAASMLAVTYSFVSFALSVLEAT